MSAHNRKHIGVSIMILILWGCMSNTHKDPIMNVVGDTQEMTRRKLGEPVVTGFIKDKDLIYEVYWRRSYQSRDWSGDRSPWILLYSSGTVVEVHEGFEELNSEIYKPIRQSYDAEIKTRLKRSLDENRS